MRASLEVKSFGVKMCRRCQPDVEGLTSQTVLVVCELPALKVIVSVGVADPSCRSHLKVTCPASLAVIVPVKVSRFGHDPLNVARSTPAEAAVTRMPVTDAEVLVVPDGANWSNKPSRQAPELTLSARTSAAIPVVRTAAGRMISSGRAYRFPRDNIMRVYRSLGRCSVGPWRGTAHGA
jgi:hypothetical protein